MTNMFDNIPSDKEGVAEPAKAGPSLRTEAPETAAPEAVTGDVASAEEFKAAGNPLRAAFSDAVISTPPPFAEPETSSEHVAPVAPKQAPVQPKPVQPAKTVKRKAAKQGKSFGASIAAFFLKAAFAGFIFSLLWMFAYRFLPVPGTTLMAQRAIQGVTVYRTPVSISNISPHLVRAVIAAEDSKFCKHDGFDFDAMNMAFEANETGKKLRGGSTISQQTAKNVFLWQDRSFIRKGFEAYFTLLIETFWPKRRIMEAYLNSIEFGHGYFGAEAAARGYFGKSAAKLSARESAALASILPSPNKWRAVKPGRYVARRIGIVQKRMTIVRRDELAACVYPN